MKAVQFGSAAQLWTTYHKLIDHQWSANHNSVTIGPSDSMLEMCQKKQWWSTNVITKILHITNHMDTELFIPPAAFHVGTQFQLLIVLLLMPPIRYIFCSTSWDLFICMSFVPPPVATIKA